MFRKLIFAAFITAISLPVYAQSIADAVGEVLANDPVLTAERKRLRGLEDEIHAENTLAGPEFGMSYRWGLDGVGDKWGVDLTQGFDWPGLYRARSRHATMQAGAFATLYRAKEVQQALVVRRAVYTLLAARADMDELSHWEENLQELIDIYDRQLERGETTILEVSKLKLEIFQARTRIAEAQNRLHAAEADLQALNAGTLPAALPRSVPLEELHPYDYYRELLDSDPEIAASRRLFDLAQQESKVASLKAAPGFRIGYVYENEAGEHFHGFSFGITLPAWNNRATRRASEARLIETMAQSDLVALQRTSQVKAQYTAAENARRLIESGQEIFGDGTDYLTILRKALDGGKINLLEFIRQENEFLQAALEYNALCLSYNLEAASLNRADFAAND